VSTIEQLRLFQVRLHALTVLRPLASREAVLS
jgi:hypothetical protein